MKWLDENYGLGGSEISYEDCAKYVTTLTNQLIDLDAPDKTGTKPGKQLKKRRAASFLYQTMLMESRKPLRRLQ